MTKAGGIEEKEVGIFSSTGGWVLGWVWLVCGVCNAVKVAPQLIFFVERCCRGARVSWVRGTSSSESTGLHWPGDQGPSGFIDMNQVSLGMAQAPGGEGDNPSALRLAGLLSQRRPNSSPKQNRRPHTSSDRLPHPATADGKKFNGRTPYLHHRHAMRYDGKTMARHWPYATTCGWR